VKINVDGAFDEHSGEGGIGVVVRNHKGEVLLSAWKFLQSGGAADEAEALSCKQGLTLAADWYAMNAVLETDCSTIAAMLAGKGGERSSLKFIIDEAIAAGDRLPKWTAVYMRRESNSVAHKLAQLAKRSRHSAVWHFAAPVCVERNIAHECTFVSE
jgi:ribonuclease HI